MIYALDSNTISYMLREEGNTLNNFVQEIVERKNGYAIPFIVAHEIERWLLYRPTRETMMYLDKFAKFFGRVRNKAEIPETVWNKATEIYISLKAGGKLIGNADILIAAYCLVNDYTLVTRNTKDFERIEGLKLVNWFE